MNGFERLRVLRGRGYKALAAFLEVALVAELALTGELFWWWPFNANAWWPSGDLVLGSILAASLALWARLPWVPIVVAPFAVITSGQPPTDGPISTLIALVLVAFLAGWQPGGRPRLAVTGVAAMVFLAVVHEFAPDIQPSDVALPWLLFGGAWLAGVALRLRAERETIEVQARADQATAAVQLERVRIARELHDAVAHAIGIIVIQARGGRRALPGDLAASRQALDAIEATAVDALGEMRQLVGVLREGDDPAALAPAPHLADLEHLVADVRAAGLPVELRVVGDPVELPSGLELSAFRLVQEALTNVMAHAGPAQAEVTLHYRPTELEIEVANTGSSSPEPRASGHGLLGMRERVAMYGGQLDVRPRVEGGFVVRARLPLAGAVP